MDKLKVYHFHNGSGGGVLSVIKNLIRFSNNPLIENHIIHAINKKEIPKYNIELITGAISQQLFYYTPKNNFYYTCKQLAKLLPNYKAIIVAHDWIELGMVSNLGLQNPLVQVLHGDFDYYYELAVKNQAIIKSFICISPIICKKLKNIMAHRESDIYYINFPVPFIAKKNTLNESLNLIFYARDLNDHRKQFSMIIAIVNKLAIEKNKYFFTIAGGGYTEEDFLKKWPTAMLNKVKFCGSIPNEAIIDLLPLQDVFLLPSLSEGLPVSLIEAMKAGVVPLVTDWDGAVDELITDGESGYYLKIGDVDGYVSKIKGLKNNRFLLKTLSDNCSEVANRLFDPQKNTKTFETIFENCSKKMNLKKRKKIYGSRLDQPWLPNFITGLLRGIRIVE